MERRFLRLVSAYQGVIGDAVLAAIDAIVEARSNVSHSQVALDRASQAPMRYPNLHHRLFALDRNPQLFPHHS